MTQSMTTIELLEGDISIMELNHHAPSTFCTLHAHKNLYINSSFNYNFSIIGADRISTAFKCALFFASQVNKLLLGKGLMEGLCNFAENGVKCVHLLPGANDEHGGIIVEMKESLDPSVFQLRLMASLQQWKLQGKKGVWIKLPIALVNLVEIAVKEGFWYHHAEPEYLMLVCWLPETSNTIPANATHRVRIGAIVVNDKRELLVVQEKIGRFQGTGIWKFPTGIIDEGEDIFRGAIREVKEETGVDTEFVEILAFRQIHKIFFEKSELMFLCMLRPLSFEIQKQDSEVEAVQWMPLDEYAAQPFSQKHGLCKHINEVYLAKVENCYSGFTPVPITSYFDDPLSYLYLNKHCLKLKNGSSHS